MAGLKNTEAALATAARLDGLVEIDLVTEPLPRPVFLARIAEATVCIFLPVTREGFFLPPLEAMALGFIKITPKHRKNTDEGASSLFAREWLIKFLLECFRRAD